MASTIIPDISQVYTSKYSRAITHSGSFSADNVLSTALMKLVYPGFTYKRLDRMPDGEITSDMFIYDMGHILHAQFDSSISIEFRNNGLRYSTFGLIWREFGEQFLPSTSVYQKYLAPIFDEEIIQPIDKFIFEGEEHQLASEINKFALLFKEFEVYGSTDDTQYEKAVEFARAWLERELEHYCIQQDAIMDVEGAVKSAEDNRIITFSGPVNSQWIREFFRNYVDCVDFLIRASQIEGYNVWPIKQPLKKNEQEITDPEKFKWRVPLPEGWYGKTPEELYLYDNHLRWCDVYGQMAVFTTQDTAEAACKKILIDYAIDSGLNK